MAAVLALKLYKYKEIVEYGDNYQDKIGLEEILFSTHHGQDCYPGLRPFSVAWPSDVLP